MDNQMESQEQDIPNDNIIYGGNHDFCTSNNCNVNKLTNKYCMGNFCTYCKINLGSDNPRQLCRKTYFPDEKYFRDEVNESDEEENMKKKLKLDDSGEGKENEKEND